MARAGAGSRIVSGFVLVAVLTVGSKVVSFVKDASVARQFGTGDALDAFLVSFGLLTFLAALAGGGLPESFVPAYTEVAHQKGPRRATRLAVQISSVHAFSLLVLAGLCYFIAPQFVQWTTRGFSPEKKDLAISLLRHLLPFMVFYGMAYQLSAWLRANKRFGIATSAQCLVPLTIIAFLLHAGSASTVETLVQGTVVGAGLHLLTLAIAVLGQGPQRDGRFWKSCFLLREPTLRRVCRQSAHYLVAGAIFSSSVIVDQAMAAWLSPGSVAVLGYSDKICGIILAVTVAPSSDVLFPYFAEKVARRDWAGVRRQLLTSASAIVGLAMPAVLLLCWLAPWVISLLFERGSFTAEDTARVAGVLRFAVWQIPFYIIGSLASRVVVAMQTTHFILWISVAGLISNAVMNWFFMRSMGAAGIALATVLVQMSTAVAACIYVLKKIRVKMASVPVISTRG